MTVDYRVGDTREVTKTIADGSVDLIASSPPFLALRSYVPADHESKGDEIGSEANPSAFIDMLLGLTAEWGRVLAAHGSIAIELGDTYSGSGSGSQDYTDPSSPRYKGDLSGVRITIGEHWPRAKSLALIPQLYAVALAYGINPLTGKASPAGRWLVRNVIVWHRPNPAVGALGDKVRPSTSYIVVATRSPKRWFDLTAVRGPSVRGSRPNEINGTGIKPITGSRGDDGKPLAKAEWSGSPPLDAWFDEYDSDLAEATSYDGTHDTWTLTTQPSKLCHYAMWPAKLAERLILSMCPAQVCRQCGEPRRRIETLSIGMGGYHQANGGGMRTNGFGRTCHNGETLGWTDCGCDLDVLVDAGSGNAPVGDVGVAPSIESPIATSTSNYRPGLSLDPFAGSGTTLAVADLHGRDAIGIDFDARNKAIYPARYDEVKRALFGTPAPMPGQEAFDFEVTA